MDATEYFRGKNVTLMRIGLLGRGVGDAAYLAKCGANVLVVDDAPQEVMQPSVDALKEYPNISFKFGPYDLQDFTTCDFVLKGAGTPLQSPEIAEARKRGIPIKMSASLFAEIAQIPVVGITGTRGKSTVTHMIEAIYKEAGKKFVLGGNVRGVSTLALLPEVTPEHVALFELDSWQLQGFGDAKMSPSVAVFTTFYRDHMNYYHDDMDVYLEDKAQIFLHQEFDDVLILGTQCAEIIQEKYGKRIKSKIVIAGGGKAESSAGSSREGELPKDWKLQIPGAHNRYNAALALAVARAQGISDEVSRATLESFAGVEGRLQLVRTIDGVQIYNDTNSTTPTATLTALAALAEEQETSSDGKSESKKKILLIMGGADKGLDMSELIAKIPSVTKRVILLAGTGTERIRTELPDAELYENLAMAFADARAHADSGDVILFSPAFASFGMFKNEYDRGDRFLALVNGIQE